MTRFLRIAGPIGTAIALSPAIALAQANADADRYGWGSHMMGWGGGWTGMIFGPIFMIVVLAGIIALAVLLVRWLGGTSTPGTSQQSSVQTPHDILRERFARGEIDKEEYEERRRILGD